MCCEPRQRLFLFTTINHLHVTCVINYYYLLFILYENNNHNNNNKLKEEKRQSKKREPTPEISIYRNI